MKKIKTKIAYGLTVLSLFAIFGKVTLIKIIPCNSNNAYSYKTEPDNYDGVRTLGFISHNNYTNY